MFHFIIEKPRGRRRRVTRTLALRRRVEHARMRKGCEPTVRDTAATFFAKNSPHACGCHKRTKGQPKVACGMCDIGQRDRILRWRQEARALRVSHFWDE